MTPEEVLLKAADEIGEHGHCKQMYLDGATGALCAYGAMTKAVVGNAEYTSTRDIWTSPDVNAMELINQAAGLLAGTIGPLDLIRPAPFSAVTRFNDDPETTGEDVILAMKRAAHHG